MKFAYYSRFFLLTMSLFSLLYCNNDDITRPPVTSAVAVGDNFFSPESLFIEHGTTVTWFFQGHNSHTVTDAHSPSNFDSGERISGSFQVTFSEPDTISYFCHIHGETGTIEVR